MISKFLKDINIHTDWNGFLTFENQKLLQQIENTIIENEFTPSAEKVLRFFELPLKKVNVIILGQDPYPQPNVATGRAFEVATLKSWNEPFRNVSLKNILRNLYKSYTGKIVKYNELKAKFDNEFPVLLPDKLFKHWEKQGVLLLNTSFTCEPGNPGSHKKIWADFTERLLNFIASDSENITWFLWGNHALEATQNIKINKKIISQHPMMCYNKVGREMDFLYGKTNCFKELQNEIDWTGFSLKNKIKTEKLLF